MNVLALEFSSSQRSVAVLSAGAGPKPSAEAEVIESGGVATRALGMIEEALTQARVEREALDCLAVGLGPGSYTGVRAALALAQGFQLAGPIQVVGISSAESLAAQAHAQGIRGLVAIVIDAQRQEFYLATYQIDTGGWIEVQPLRLASHADVQTCHAAGQQLLGPDLNQWFPEGQVVFPRATALGRLALARKNRLPGETLEPIYLRATTFVKAPPPRFMP